MQQEYERDKMKDVRRLKFKKGDLVIFEFPKKQIVTLKVVYEDGRYDLEEI